MNSSSTHKAKKRFGQNFLIDKSVINRVVDCIQPQSDDLMIEIGPGLGAMTIPLLSRLNQLTVIELDRDIIPKLVNNTTIADSSNRKKLTITEKDVLKFDVAEYYNRLNSDKKIRFVGNLPYNISTPVLFHLLKYRYLIGDMHFMLQKEVVDRITARPNNKEYGRLSVMLQTYCFTQAMIEIPPSAFRPAPKVDSAIVQLIPKSVFEINLDNEVYNFDRYKELIRQAFSQRRKTLKNTLKAICTAEQIENAGLSPDQRAEELSVSDFQKLYQSLPDRKPEL